MGPITRFIVRWRAAFFGAVFCAFFCGCLTRSATCPLPLFAPAGIESRPIENGLARAQALGSPESSDETATPINPAPGKEHPELPWPAATATDPNKQTFQLRGRIEADAILVHQSARDQAIVGDIQDAVGFRRARLGAEGNVGEQMRWIAEFDFAGGEIGFRDVYVAVDKLPIVGEVRVGNFREPFGLEGQTSSNYFTFIERSDADALDPARHWGVGVFSYLPNERATFAGGAFRSGSDNTGTDIGSGNDMAYTFRVTGLPWFAAEDRLMHLGGAFSQQIPPNDLVTFNQGPRNSLLETSDNPLVPFVANLQIPASQLQLYNLEWALVLGPLSFQAEWDAASIDQIGGGRVFLQGGYVFASYFLTGEHRQYLTKAGAFGMTHVRSPFLRLGRDAGRPAGWGAWELAARLSYLDFADPNIPRSAAGLQVGGRLSEATFGVNWYLNDYTRLMFNYVHAIPVDPNFGPSAADAFFFRCAIFW